MVVVPALLVSLDLFVMIPSVMTLGTLVAFRVFLRTLVAFVVALETLVALVRPSPSPHASLVHAAVLLDLHD